MFNWNIYSYSLKCINQMLWTLGEILMIYRYILCVFSECNYEISSINIYVFLLVFVCLGVFCMHTLTLREKMTPRVIFLNCHFKSSSWAVMLDPFLNVCHLLNYLLDALSTVHRWTPTGCFTLWPSHPTAPPTPAEGMTGPINIFMEAVSKQ